MVLETLDNRIDVTQLGLDQESEPKSAAKSLFDAMKRTKLYDSADGIWSEGISKEGNFAGPEVHIGNQLLGALAESLFDPAKGREIYEHLKRTGLHEPATGEWITSATFKDIRTNSQLIGIVVEAERDKEQARRHLAALAEKIGFNPHGFWLQGKDAADTDDIYVDDQLWGIYATSLFDKQAARGLYDRLKTTIFYDENSKLWHRSIENLDPPILGNNNFMAGSQLLGILALSQFDRQAAREAYEYLKKTPLYDPAAKLWNNRMDIDYDLVDDYRYSYANLIAVLVEQALAEQALSVSSQTPMPAERKF